MCNIDRYQVALTHNNVAFTSTGRYICRFRGTFSSVGREEGLGRAIAARSTRPGFSREEKKRCQLICKVSSSTQGLGGTRQSSRERETSGLAAI